MLCRLIFTFIFALFLSGCNPGVDEFYTTSRTEDIDVLPLIKPYRLWTPIPQESIWHLDFLNKVDFEMTSSKKITLTQINVCKINVCNHLIFGHCMSSTAFPNYYFVVIPEKNIERTFVLQTDWLTFLKENGVTKLELYDVLELYTMFKENPKTLPWYDQVIKAQ